jgi:ubiquinone biosynthesis protein
LGFKPLSPRKLKDTVTYLGASFIKLAQVLATRADFFSEEYLIELKSLHDQLPPMSKKEFDLVYNRAFKDDSFKSFENTPIASASIGQVHIAYLYDGSKVAVKLRRYKIQEQVKADIKIINFFNHIFKPLFSYYTKNSIEAVINEFAKMIKEEVSLNTELKNLKKFSNVYKDENIKFPKPYEEFCSDDALCMSFEDGFRFDDKENVLKYKIDFKKLISDLVHFYTTQMLINGYFHADPHPGNILVQKDGSIVMLDFGMVKTVPDDKRVAIIELIKAANEQDYETYIRASKKLGTIAYEAPTSELAEFTSKMFEIFSDDNLSSESMQKLAFEVLEGTRDMPFKLPSDAIYILRVSAIIEGLGTTYIENFNGVKDILPILQKNIPRALHSKDTIIEALIDEVKEFPFFVNELKSAVKKANGGELEVQLSKAQLEWIAKILKSYLKSYSISFAFILLAFFLVFIEPDWKNISIVVFLIGFFRLIYK